MAPRATFFYGGRSVSWTDLCGWQKTIYGATVSASLTRFFWPLQASRALVTPQFLGFLSLLSTVEYRSEYATRGPNRPSHVLRSFGVKAAGVPVGKVFALVGMTREGADARLKRLIDYGRPAEDVLLDPAHYLLDVAQALDVLDPRHHSRQRRRPP